MIVSGAFCAGVTTKLLICEYFGFSIIRFVLADLVRKIESGAGSLSMKYFLTELRSVADARLSFFFFYFGENEIFSSLGCCSKIREIVYIFFKFLLDFLISSFGLCDRVDCKSIGGSWIH